MCKLNQYFGLLAFVVASHLSTVDAVDIDHTLQSVNIRNLVPASAPLIFVGHEARDAPSCPAFSQSIDDDQGYDGTSSAVSPTPSSTTVPPSPAPSCDYNGPEPENFIPQAYCMCQGSITLPLITPTSTPAPESASCAYQTLPSSTANPVTNLPPATTSNCMIYQQVGGNEDDDKTVPGCIPTGKPTTNVTLSNNKIAAGNQGGQGFIEAILNVLKPKCHDVVNGNGQCDSKGGDVDNIEYVEKDGGDLEKATMTFTIENAKYRTNQQRDSMLNAVALAFNASAQGKNCGDVKYAAADTGAQNPTDPNDVSAPGPGFMHPINQCNVPNLIIATMIEDGVEVAIMAVEASFKIDGWSLFDCELVADLVGALLTVTAPEAEGEDLAIVGEIEASCEELAAMADGGGGG